MAIDDIIKHLEKNEAIAPYDREYYMKELKKLGKSEKPDEEIEKSEDKTKNEGFIKNLAIGGALMSSTLGAAGCNTNAPAKTSSSSVKTSPKTSKYQQMFGRQKADAAKLKQKGAVLKQNNKIHGTFTHGELDESTKKCPGCGKPFKKDEPYQDVENCEACERFGKPNKSLNESLDNILLKIESKTLTCEDLNNFILETTPESVRERVRRRTRRNETDSHIDTPTGHQQLGLPSFTDRVAPKRKPSNQQSHGRGKIGHKHSTKSQQK